MTQPPPDSPRPDLLGAFPADCASDASDPLASVVAACRSGNRDAQRCLYDSCHHEIYRLAVRMVGQEDAADVTQQVFMQAFRKLEQFSGRSKFQTWLYRLAINEALQFRRRSRRHAMQHIEEETLDEAPSHASRTEQREAIEFALQQLDPELRTIFVLREVEQLSYQEIAETLSVPEGTVGSRLNRARRELRHLLENYL